MNYYFMCKSHGGIVIMDNVSKLCPICNSESFLLMNEEEKRITDEMIKKRVCFNSFCRHLGKEHENNICKGIDDDGKTCTCKDFKAPQYI